MGGEAVPGRSGDPGSAVPARAAKGAVGVAGSVMLAFDTTRDSRRRRRRSAARFPNRQSSRRSRRGSGGDRGIPSIQGAPGREHRLTWLRWKRCRRRRSASGAALPARTAKGAGGVQGGVVLLLWVTHESAEPGSEISRSRALVRAGGGSVAPPAAEGRWDISAPGSGAPRAWSRGAAVGTATARAFARHRLTSRGPWRYERGVSLLLTLMLTLSLAARAFAPHRLASRGPWRCRRGVALLLTPLRLHASMPPARILEQPRAA